MRVQIKSMGFSNRLKLADLFCKECLEYETAHPGEPMSRSPVSVISFLHRHGLLDEDACLDFIKKMEEQNDI